MHAAPADFPELDGGPEAVSLRPRSAVEGYHIVELFGGMVKVGEYYAKIELGGQMVRTQIDTGSATLAAPLKTCKSCLRGDRRYDIDASVGKKGNIIACDDSTHCMRDKCSPFSCGGCSEEKACCSKTEPTKCGFHLSFGDGSGAQGMLVKDDLSWGGVSFPVVFGGINQDSPDFERQQVDGILGMAYPTLACNPSCVKPAFESMVDHLKMKNIFQICITADSGKIILGDWDKTLMKAPPVWVPMHLASPPTYYTMQLTGNMQVNEREVVFPRYKLAIADSGTTLIVFNKRSFKIFVDHLKEHYCHVPGLCGAMSWFRPAHCTKIREDDRRKMPTLKFSMAGGFDVELGPDEYLINYESKGPDFWCVGLMALDALSGGIDVIFGNTVMKKYVTVYDRENERIGFGLSNGDCKGGAAKVGGGAASEEDKVPVSAPTIVSAAPASSAAAAPPPPPPPKKKPVVVGDNAPKPQKKKKDDVFVSSGKCGAAKACGACANVAGGNCVWSTAESQCMVGQPTTLMCTIDLITTNIVFPIAGIVVLVVLLITCVACGVCAYRKRQSAAHEAAVDSDEAFESRVPLAPANGDQRRRGDDSEIETF